VAPLPGTARPTSARNVDVSLKTVEERHKTFRYVVKWGVVAFWAYFADRAIAGLAGRSTNVVVQTGLQLFGDFRVTIAITLAGVWVLS
jgi:hypothetical protein